MGDWIQILASSLVSYATLNQSLNLLVPQVAHLKKMGIIVAPTHKIVLMF